MDQQIAERIAAVRRYRAYFGDGPEGHSAVADYRKHVHHQNSFEERLA